MKKIMHIFANSEQYPNKFVPDYARFLKDGIGKVENSFFVFGDRHNLATDVDFKLVSKSIFGLISLACQSRNFDKVIFHSIPSRFFLIFLFFNFLSFSKVKNYLVLWGGEVHFIKQSTLKDKINHKLNNLFMRFMDGFITYLKADFELAIKLSGNKSACWVNIQSVYPSNVARTEFLIDKNAPLRILIGASALKGNRHFETIDLLANAAFDGELEYIIPLSYGDREYAEQVIAYANSKLPGKVKPLTDFMSIDEYTKLLSTIHIAFFMHTGQQGMGNIRNLLALGANVYMNRESISYTYFSELNFKVFDIHTVTKITFESDMGANIELARELFSREKLLQDTERFFLND